MKPNLAAHWTDILYALSRLRARAPASGPHESCPASPPRPSAGRCSSFGAPFCQNLCQTGCLGVRDVVGGPRHTHPLAGSVLLGIMAFAGAKEWGSVRVFISADMEGVTGVTHPQDSKSISHAYIRWK